jgi:inner membrane protein
MATHGVLDAFTDGGQGIALFWPFSNQRYFAPWTPIPVAPIGMGMLSQRGLHVILTELALFSPLFLLAVMRRKRK